MTQAFHGRAEVKDDLLARLRRHAAAGTLLFGPTRWDGTRGSPLGVSAESESSDDYVARFGYPLALAGLLDPITAADRENALVHAIAWAECVAPGRDLCGVPLSILEDLLDRLGARNLAPAEFETILSLHRREAAGEPAAAATWRQLRVTMETAADSDNGPPGNALRACALACWPLAKSRSVLVELIRAWSVDARPPAHPDFDAADRARAQATLEAILEETKPRRQAGEQVHSPGIFRARDADLAARFEADLARANAFHLQRVAEMPALVLTHLGAAGAA